MISSINSKIDQGFRYLQKVFRDEQFYVVLRHVIGSFIPLIIGEILGYEMAGLTMMMGCFFVSGVDMAGTFKTKAKALLYTTGFTISMSFLVLVTGDILALQLPLLFIFIFGLAYISPFSLRYLIMAIMGYLAIIIAVSMMDRFETIEGILHFCLLLLCGSVWYIMYALFLHYFAATREINRRIAHSMRQTADYFDQRLALLESDTSYSEGLIELAHLQQQLNNTQESVRELLYSDTSSLTERSSERRRFYLIFVELVDMHELAMAAPVDYPKMREILHRYPEYDIIRQIIRRTSDEMRSLADVLLKRRSIKHDFDLQDDIEDLQARLQELKQKTMQQNQHDEEAYHTLKQIESYLHRQIQKAAIIREIVLSDQPSEEKSSFHANRSSLNLSRFITPDPLNKDSLLDNFSFESSYFRYALRTAVTAVAGYTLAQFLHFRNAYWVLLTVLIVMRPGYGVTRSRFFHRTLGTLAGAVIAFGLYQMGPSHMVSLIIFGISFLLGFTFVIHNYAIATTFFTIFVMFLYNFLQRDVPIMIVYRVIDTAVGAALVLLAIHFLWPYWEHRKFSDILRSSLGATKNYLNQVLTHLNEKRFNEEEYRLARKQAYVEIANVISSYYRLRDEPESKQKNVQYSYDLALLAYMLLSAITSLGNFLQRFDEQEAAQPEYQTLGRAIVYNIEFSLRQLKSLEYIKKHPAADLKAPEVEKAAEKLARRTYKLRKQLDLQEQMVEGKNPLYRQYVYLNSLRRQLTWMIDLSRSIAEHAAEPQEQ